MDVGTSKRGGPTAAINVTPLVDIVLVLLIIFMVLTPSTLKHLTATVPQEADEDAPSPPVGSSLMIEYSARRELTLNGESIAMSALASKLAERLSAMRKKVVFVQANDDAPYREVVHLMDIARGAGADSLAVVTR